MLDFWVILTGVLVAIPCALIGSFLLLRKMVMLGDAISHAVLPGIVIAYFITESFDSSIMLLFAAITGVFSTVLIELFNKKANVQEDAAIGVTFTWLFALGVILISVFANQTDLDQECVLYGEILTVPFNVWYTESGLNLGPITIWYLSGVTLFVIGLIVFAYKELFITTFDSAYAIAIGVSVSFWHYVLMGTVSLVTVSAFEAVGAILVVAFLVIPPATAYLITTSLKKMLLLAVSFGILSVILGYYISGVLDTSTSAMMVCVSGIQFLLVMFLQLMIKRYYKMSFKRQELN